MLFSYVPSGASEAENTTESQENAVILRAFRHFWGKKYNCNNENIETQLYN